MPAWIWVISQGTLMDLGIQIPQKINLLSHVLLQTLSFPHVLRAELLLLDQGWCPQPMGDQALTKPCILTRHSISSSPSSASSPQHLHLGYLPSSGARPWEGHRWGHNERCTERHQGEAPVSMALEKHSGRGKDQLQNQPTWPQQLCSGRFDLTT